MIESIEVCGFKVFPGSKIFKIDLIPEGFILIGGPNFRGKSSIYQGLGFSLIGTKGVFSRNRKRNLVNYDEEYCMVRVHLRNFLRDGSKAFPGIETKSLVIERVIGKTNSNNDYIKVNGINMTPSELKSILLQAHIDPNNPYQFVSQGELPEIINKTPQERLKLLDIFIPASETAKNFMNGLRQIQRAMRSQENLKIEEFKYKEEEAEKRKIRDLYERKANLQNRLKNTNALLVFKLEQELNEEKNNTSFSLSEANRRIQDFENLYSNKNKLIESVLKQNEKTEKEIIELKKRKKEIQSIILKNEKERENIKITIARYNELLKELADSKYITIEKAEEQLNKIQKKYFEVKRDIEHLNSQAKEIQHELELLEQKITKPLSVIKALKIAEQENIKAVFTFENTEWNTENLYDRKRLEIILTYYKESIMVFSYEDAEILIKKGVEIPILVAHTEKEQCKLLNIQGKYNKLRSTLIQVIQEEWSQIQNNFEEIYTRQIKSSDFIYNLVNMSKYEYQPFIGMEALKSRKDRLNVNLEKLSKQKRNKQEKLESLNSNIDYFKTQLDLAKKFAELNSLERKQKPAIERLKEIEVENINLNKKKEENEEDIIHKSEKKALLEKEKEEIQEELEKFQKSINDNKKIIPSLEEKYKNSKEKYNQHFEKFKEELKLGKELSLKNKNIGTISGLKEDIERFNNEIIEIGDVPEDAIEKHDEARKRYEKFKFQVKNQLETVDINPEKVKEDIHQYELALKRFINKINKNLKIIMEELGGEANFLLRNTELNEDTWEYKAGLKIFVEFKGKKKIEVDKHCNLSGGEKTRLIIAILIALIRSQEERYNFPFLILDEFDAQLDEAGHKQIMQILKREIGTKQLIIFSPNRLKDKAIVADMILAFTNKSDEEPKIEIIASRERIHKDEMPIMSV